MKINLPSLALLCLGIGFASAQDKPKADAPKPADKPAEAVKPEIKPADKPADAPKPAAKPADKPAEAVKPEVKPDAKVEPKK